MSIYVCQKCYEALCAVHGEQEVYTISRSMTEMWACDFGDAQARYMLPHRSRPFSRPFHSTGTTNE